LSELRKLKQQILEEGVDLRIDEVDWARIRALLPGDGSPDPEDLKVLLEMRTEARVVCPEFDAYFFPVFKAFLLADGKISVSEHFQLLRMLYGGGGIDPVERRFLEELRDDVREPTPEFEAMYEQVMRD
jgi:hypothetical protein